MIISERIFELLNAKGISQKDFAKKTGISQSTISDWRRKKTNPASDKIMLICDVLDVTPYELLSGVEKEKYKPLDYIILDKNSDDYRYLELYRQCDAGQKNRVLGYMEAILGK